MRKVIVNDKEFRKMIPHKEIKKRVKEIAARINKSSAGQDLIFIPVLNGAFMFASDLLKSVEMHSLVSFIKIKSYTGTTSSGDVQQVIGLDADDIKGRHVIIVEDIIDTGLTIQHISEEIEKLEPASVRVATLLFKKESLKYDIVPDWYCFEIPGRFVIGYGLDFDGYGRNLKHIYKAV